MGFKGQYVEGNLMIALKKQYILMRLRDSVVLHHDNAPHSRSQRAILTKQRSFSGSKS